MIDEDGVRRIVTGHTQTGESTILSDGYSPQFNSANNDRVRYFELWNTAGSPTPISAVPEKEPNDCPLVLPPPANGTIIRIVDVFPGNHEGMVKRADGQSSGMHRTKTIDYGMVLEGEITMMVSQTEERLMKKGDVCIQRGTDHAWQNRSDKVCRLLFVLVDGEFDENLKSILPDMNINIEAPSLNQQ